MNYIGSNKNVYVLIKVYINVTYILHIHYTYGFKLNLKIFLIKKIY